MPRRAAKFLSAVARVASSKKLKAKSRVIGRRVAQGTLFAVTLAAARIDPDEAGENRRLFGAGLIDRLKAPITRYHE